MGTTREPLQAAAQAVDSQVSVPSGDPRDMTNFFLFSRYFSGSIHTLTKITFLFGL